MNQRDDAPDDAVNSRGPRDNSANALRRFVVWSLFGGIVGVVLVLLALRRANYDPTPTLTGDRFDAAYRQWQSRETGDYEIEIRVTGRQAATYRVHVSAGAPTAAWRNGKPLTSLRTFGTWSVPGMFSTISRDIAALEQAAASGKPPPLILRAAFDPELGYPQRYQRIDNGSRRGGDSIAVTWDVVEFRSVKATSQPAEQPVETLPTINSRFTGTPSTRQGVQRDRSVMSPP